MTTTSLQLDYVPAGDLATRSPGWWSTVLGVVGFDEPPRIDAAPAPVAASMTPALGGANSLVEVWRVVCCAPEDGPSADSRWRGRVHYRSGGGFLFGSIALDEQAGGGSPSAALLQATTAAYEEIFAVLAATGHDHPIRVWNYLPEINGDADGAERYRHFNAARQSAFHKSGRNIVGSVPAACALGSPAGSPLSIYFLASRRAPFAIENPRQISAYHYPPRYGAHSPTFSRACLLRDSAGTNLFVSGTASIVGHETIHPGDVTAQTHETLANIGALVEEANRLVGARRYALDGLQLKVYVRRAPDFRAVEDAVSRTVSGARRIVYLHADVCREDLLVEIEAAGAAA
jgi:enamine deaminase RidA (YjgF/YER057c/UK114 family)